MKDETILKRKIYDKLLKWKDNSNGSTAILIEGARRIGKSTIVEEFAKNEYDSYILIDFNNVENEIKNLFTDERRNLDLIFDKLQLSYGIKLYDRKSAIIFDEVQLCPMARSLIKYLVKDGRYDYIETGSLISLKKNIQNIVIPSEEEKIKMYPLDYEEFCWAMGDTVTIPFLKKYFDERKPMKDMHKKAMNNFRLYLLIGGMPQAVLKYKETKNLEDVDKIKRDILTLYEEDIHKFSYNNSEKVLAIYDRIPGQLSKGNKRFILTSINENARNREYEDSFKWLDESMIVNLCFNVTDPNIGLALTSDKTSIKCYSSDTGLLVTQVFKNKEYLDNDIYKSILFDKLNINEGMIVENVIAQILKTNGYDLYFYNRVGNDNSKDTMEIDFIIVKDKKMSPIEVKSGNYKKHTSIDRFKNKFKKNVGTRYVIHTKDLKIEDDILYLPLYMAIFL